MTPLVASRIAPRAMSAAGRGYPPAVLDLIAEETAFAGHVEVADVGSGTGIFRRLLLDSGYAVRAIEPDPSMREAAERALGHHPRLHSVGGRAESTGLPAASVDLVVAAQAFHWFALEPTGREWPLSARGSEHRHARGRTTHEENTSIDDHLAAIAVPLLYLGAAGGFGSEGLYATGLTASRDISVHIVSVQSDTLRAIDFGHADLFTATDARTLAWEPLREWLAEHVD